MRVLFEKLGFDLVEMFKDSDRSIAEVFAELGTNLLVNSLDIVSVIMSGIFELFGDILVEMAGLLNKPIKIPVLSALYKSLSGGHELTVLDAICLIMAIPTTIVYKVLRNESPSKIPGADKINSKDLYGQTLKLRLSQINKKGQSGPKQELPKGHKAQELEYGVDPFEDIKNYGAAELANLSWGKLVAKTIKFLAPVIAIGGPAAGRVWFTFKTFPTLPSLVADPTPMSFGSGLFLWLVSVPYHFEKPGNRLRLASWVISGVNVLANLIPAKQIQHVVSIASHYYQLILIIPTYVMIKKGNGVIDGLFVATEVTTLIARIAFGCAGVMLGAEPVSTISSYLLTEASFALKIIHANKMLDDGKIDELENGNASQNT